jgi:hypothetical protein
MQFEKSTGQVGNKIYRNDDTQLIGIPRPQQALKKRNKLAPYSLTNFGGLTNKT